MSSTTKTSRKIPRRTATRSKTARTSSANCVGREMGLLCAHFAAFLSARFAADPSPVGPAIEFLQGRYNEQFDKPPRYTQRGLSKRVKRCAGPIGNLARHLDLSNMELQVLLLAGMAEHHEGLSDVLGMLHPNRAPYFTGGLAAQMFCHSEAERVLLREVLTASPLIELGALYCEGSGPLLTCSLRVPSALWTLLLDGTAELPELPELHADSCKDGLQEWFDSPALQTALRCLRNQADCSIVVAAGNATHGLHRGLAMCAAADVTCRPLEVDEKTTQEAMQAIRLQSILLNEVPVLLVTPGQEGSHGAWPSFRTHTMPVILCCRSGDAPDIPGRASMNIQIGGLSVAALKDMWGTLIPELADQTSQLAARYPVEPYLALRAINNARFKRPGAQVTLDSLIESFKNASQSGVSSSINLLQPQAEWSHLVLPENQLAQLHDAVQRLHLQGKVLDQWQFLAGRHGARGVRLLFTGPPGTGKTLSAEVLASALNVDLLQVDLSRVVSKWIGETEKNLAQVFDEAEKVKAVLFFDEADALFGKRTEVADAHDRYANLETAYLLSRLEQFDGLAVLATNFRHNIDAAFIRRLDFILEYRVPGLVEREQLWRSHVPANAPVHKNVSYAELASLFPIVGEQIRNAALSAAYFSARADTPIKREHFLLGIRREYDKAGKAFREVMEL